MIFKYKKFNIGTIDCGQLGKYEGIQFNTTEEINPNADMPKVILDAVKAYEYPNFCITFKELIEVCQEYEDRKKDIKFTEINY